MDRTVVPGVGLLVVVGLTGRLLASVVPGVHYLIVTIVVGLIVGNAYGVPEWGRTGIETHKLWLETGIVVMGVNVALDRVLSAGVTVLVLVFLTVASMILIIEFLARYVFSIDEKIGSLLAAGSGICGVSAVVAIAESIRAKDGDIAYAAATVLLFDSVTLFVYPFAGHALGLSDKVFGIWAGLTMFSTGPVTAAGFAFSETAGQWALLGKLTRNSLIGFVAIAYAMYYAHRRRGNGDDSVFAEWSLLWNTFPKFILGFVAMVIVANFGALSTQQIRSLSNAADWAFLLAFAGLGLELQLDELRATGTVSVVVVLVGLGVIATATLIVLQTLY